MTNDPIDKVFSIARDGQEIGEWTEAQVRTFYQEGQLLGTDCYWHEGMVEWKPLRNLMSARRSHALLRSLWYLFAYPFFTFWRVGSAEKRFLHTGTTTWDSQAGTVVIGKKIGLFRTILAVTLTVVSFLGILLWSAAAMDNIKHLQ